MKAYKNIEKLEQSSKGKIKFLWTYEFYRGPMTGMVDWKGKACWFDCWHDNDRMGDDKVKYEVFELTDDQLEEIKEYRTMITEMREREAYGPEAIEELQEAYKKFPDFLHPHSLKDLKVVGKFKLKKLPHPELAPRLDIEQEEE